MNAERDVASHNGQSLAGKVIVVTGGAGLLGSTFVRAIVSRGGTAVAADVDVARATAVTDAIGNAAPAVGAAVAAPLDIGDAASVEALVAQLSARFGRIDAVVNNAYPRNAQYGRRLEDVTYSDFCDNLSRHVGGYFLVSQQFAKYFKSQGHGNIVNMGSVYGTLAPRFEVYADTAMTMPVEYSAIKSGVIQMTKYFAQYFRKDGIRVNSLSPGGIFDHQAPPFLAAYAAFAGTKGMLDGIDVAGALLFLLSDDSRYMTGQNLIVDDGFSL